MEWQLLVEFEEVQPKCVVCAAQPTTKHTNEWMNERTNAQTNKGMERKIRIGLRSVLCFKHINNFTRTWNTLAWYFFPCWWMFLTLALRNVQRHLRAEHSNGLWDWRVAQKWMALCMSMKLHVLDEALGNWTTRFGWEALNQDTINPNNVRTNTHTRTHHLSRIEKYLYTGKVHIYTCPFCTSIQVFIHSSPIATRFCSVLCQPVCLHTSNVQRERNTIQCVPCEWTCQKSTYGTQREVFLQTKLAAQWRLNVSRLSLTLLACLHACTAPCNHELLFVAWKWYSLLSTYWHLIHSNNSPRLFMVFPILCTGACLYRLETQSIRRHCLFWFQRSQQVPRINCLSDKLNLLASHLLCSINKIYFQWQFSHSLKLPCRFLSKIVV